MLRRPQLFVLLKERINQFYLLAFVPLLVVAYFSVIRVVIPIYAFILLLLKRDKLILLKHPARVQKALGVLLVTVSFFVYLPMARVSPTLADPYGIPNYLLHLVGLFLVFFHLPALKEAFSPVFLIVATTSSFFISEGLKPHLSPILIPIFMRLIDTLMNLLGFPITSFFDSRIMILHTWRGNIRTIFDWGCIGVYSTLIFSIILVVILAEEKSRFQTKLAWSIVGIAGTNAVNILRILAIFLVDYAYGTEVGAQVHYFIGYALFITWLSLFFIAMSRRPFSNRAHPTNNTSIPQ